MSSNRNVLSEFNREGIFLTLFKKTQINFKIKLIK